MTTSQLRTDPESTFLGQTRSHVLALLQQAADPLSVTDIANGTDLHPNTARFHLDGLVEAGLAQRAIEDRRVPGRPRALYTANPEAPPTGPRSYRLLSEILASLLSAQLAQPAKAAVKAGAAWGRYLAEKPEPFQRIDAADATRQLVSVLDDIGFAPEAATAGRRRRILLHHCPFREVAETHGDIICSIHLGMMQGVLSELDTPLQADRLAPFVEPSLCVAQLSTPAGGPRRAATSRQSG